MKTSAAFSLACNTIPFDGCSSRLPPFKPRPQSALHRMKLRSKRFASLILAGFARAAITADMPPAALVEARTGEALWLLRAVDENALRRLVERKLLPRFDISRMTQLAAGAAWLNADRWQKRALKKGFCALLARTCIARLSASANGDMQLEVKPVRHSTANDITVRTLVKKPGKPAVAIDYRMENQPEGWKAYDVLVDGVSQIARFRESFAEEFRRSGIVGLIQAVDAAHRAPVSSPGLSHRSFA